MGLLDITIAHKAIAILFSSFLLLSSLVNSGADALSPGVIYDVQAKQGSYGGGTYLTIWGAGFNREGQEGTTVAYIGASICEPEPYDTTDFKYVCYTPAVTPPSNNGNLRHEVRVQIIKPDGTNSFARCPTPSRCYFTYSNSNTPRIDYMSAGGHYGAVHMARGTVLAYQPENLRVVVGVPKVGSAIEYLPEMHSNPHNFRAHNLVRGILGPSAGGHYNITFGVRDPDGGDTDGFGHALFDRKTKHVARNDAQTLMPGTVYHFTAVPAIESISHHASGLMGGFELTVKGSGFSQVIGENTVLLGGGFSDDGQVQEGTPCTVHFASDSEIRCTPQPATAATPVQSAGYARFSAGTGLRRRIWYRSSNPCTGSNCHNTPFHERNWGVPDIDILDTDSARSYHFNDANNYAELLDGFFVPPVTANYTFMVYSDDYGGVFLSPDEDPENAVSIAYTLRYQSFWLQDHDTAISKPIELEKGKRYAIRMQHQDASGGDYFEVSLRIHSNPDVDALYKNDNQIAFASTPSVQTILTSRDVVHEVQLVEVLNTRQGRFFLGMQGLPTTQLRPIAHNATDSQIRQALHQMYPECGNRFSVSGTRDIDAETGKYDLRIEVTFTCPFATGGSVNSHPLITVFPQTGRVNVSEPITAKSTRITMPSKPLEGTYRLRLGDVVSNPINVASTPAQLRNVLLESFSELVDVEVNYNVPNHVRDSAEYRIVVYDPPNFTGVFEPVYNVEGTPNATEYISGANATINHSVVVEGSEDPFFWNIPAWQFFENSYRAPTVQVVTNGIPAACLDSHNFDFETSLDVPAPCSFYYQEDITPIVTSVDSTQAPLHTITGERFLTANDGVGNGPFGTDMDISELCHVELAGMKYDIVSLAADEITFIAEEGPGGTHDVEVYCAFGRGKAMYADEQAIPTITIETEVHSITPSTGSIGGGTVLTISGNGFIVSGDDAMAVTLGSHDCEVLSITHSEMTCRTPAQEGHTDIALPITINGVASDTTFNYAIDSTPLLQTVSPSKLPVATSGVITLTFTDFAGASLDAEDIAIHIADHECAVSAIDANAKEIKCTVARGSPGGNLDQVVMPQVYFKNLGYAHAAQDANPVIDRSYYITQISPQIGSLMGGIPMTISGVGLQQHISRYVVNFVFHQDVEYYDEDLDEMVIAFTTHNVPCEVTDVAEDSSSISCILQAPPDFYEGEDATLTMSMNGIHTPCQDPSACEFVFSEEKTGIVTSYTIDVDDTNPIHPVTTYTFVGSNFEEPVSVFFGTEKVPEDQVLVNEEGTELVVTVPPQAAGEVPVQIGSEVYGSFKIATGAGDAHVDLKHEFPLHIHASSVAQIVGSVAGGRKIVLEGHGFASVLLPNNGFTAVRFEPASGSKNPREAYVLDVTTTSITFMAPYLTENAQETLNIRVVVYEDSTKTVERASVRLTGKYKSITDSTTAKITAYSEETIEPGMDFTLTGTNFGTYSEDMYITIGNEQCIIDEDTFSDTSVTCTVGDVPAGTHKVLFYIPDFGFAEQPSSLGVQVPLVLTEPSSPFSCGAGGGCTLELEGSGFGSVSAEPTIDVQVCNAQCRVTEHTGTSILCDVDPIVTPESLDMFGDDEVILTGKMLGPATNNPASSALDDDVTTGYSNVCRIGMVIESNSLALLSRVRWYPTFQKANAFRNAKIQVATSPVDGESEIEWETVATLAPVASADDGPVDYQDRDISQMLVEGWNYYDIPVEDAAWSQRDRYTAVSILHDAVHGECIGQEIQFIGHLITNSPDNTCPIDVMVTPKRDYVALTAPETAIERFDADFQVLANITPYITGLTTLGNPTAEGTGSALGGTTVVITGTEFSDVVDDVRVVLNGVECSVTAASTTEISCITGPRDAIRPNTVDVLIQGKGRAIFNPYQVRPFRYLDLWSSPTTWGVTQELPVEGDSVVIPRGQAVLMDISPPRLFMVLVQGELVFGKVDGLSLNATYIMAHGGRIEAGTEHHPHENTLTITLHGDRWTTVEVFGFGAKVLGIMNARVSTEDTQDDIVTTTDIYNTGYEVLNMDDDHMPGTMGLPTRASAQAALELHGKPRKRVWTKVEPGDYPAGTRMLRLSEPVDWVHGERIVVAPSSLSGFAEAEEHVVDYVENETDVYLVEPLQHGRTSTLYDSSATGHGIVDMRFEVGLLSRNIVVQGDEQSEKQLFGVHTIAVLGGTYRIEDIELRYCGQAGNLGRYCSHTHITGSQASVRSYVRANSIHHSYQRANTIHATHHMRVSDNVAYHVRGHTYFVEDGNEVENVIEGNLAVLTLRNYAGLDGDKKPASFWAASPSNHWRNNVAAGCINDGFWLELPSFPHGPSYTTTICPVGAPLGSFQNNTAHSNGVHGLRIYPIYTPFVDPCDPLSGSAPQYFHDFSSFRNGEHGIFGKKNGDLHHIRPKLLENGMEEFNQVMYVGSIEYSEDPNVVDGLVVNTIDPANNPPKRKIGLWTPQDEFFYLKGIHFVNYHPDVGALSLCSRCSDDKTLKQGGYTVRVEDMHYYNTVKRVEWTGHFNDIILDLDGSLSGGDAFSTLTPYKPYNDWDECTTLPEATYDHSTLCPREYPIRRLQMYNAEPSTFDMLNINVTALDMHEHVRDEWLSENPNPPVTINDLVDSDRMDVIKFLPKEFSGWSIPVVANKWYDIKVRSPTDWRRVTYRYSEPSLISNFPDQGEYLGIVMRHTDFRYRNRVEYMSNATLQVNYTDGLDVLPSPVRDPFGAGTFFSVTEDFLRPVTEEDLSSKRWALLLNTQNPDGFDPIDYDNRNSLSLRATNIQCPPFGCYVPPPPQRGEYTLWSDPDSWEDGFVPFMYDDVVIPPHKAIIMDIDPPILGSLTVEGALKILDRDAKLEAYRIVVWGEMFVGTTDLPFNSNLEIILHGEREDPATIIDNNLFLGNKNIVVLGELHIHGTPKAVTWTKLASPAAAGDDTIELTASVADEWKAGDSVVISATEFDLPIQSEVAVIASISNDGKTVTLAEPLQYTHYAGPAMLPGTASNSRTTSQTVSAAVGLLTHNVVIRPDFLTMDNGKPTDTEDTYGFHIIVAAIHRLREDLPDPSNPTENDWITRVGFLDARYVEFRGGGKGIMEYPTVNIQYGSYLLDPTTTPDATYPLPPDKHRHNNLIGNSFTYSFNSGFASYSVYGITLRNNVFHDTRRFAIEFDAGSAEAVIERNLISGVYQSEDLNQPDMTLWVSPVSGIYLHTNKISSFRGNLVSGSVDAGITLRPATCPGDYSARKITNKNNLRKTFMDNNEVHSTLVGVFFLGTRAQCSVFNGFTVWKAAHIGLLAVDAGSPKFIVSDVTVIDAHIGLSLNFANVVKKEVVTHEVTHSLFIGVATAAADASDLGASVHSRAMTAEDPTGTSLGGSVMGASWVRTGIIGSQYTNRGKTAEFDVEAVLRRPPNRPERLCGMPWEKRYGLPSTRGTHMFLTDIVFAGFPEDYQGFKTVAYSINPTQVDQPVPVTMDKIVWDDVPLETRFNFRIPGGVDSACSDNCDGRHFALISDLDGSVTGTAGSSVVPNNPALVDEHACNYVFEWSGYYCPDIQFRQAIIENMDRDRGFRRIGTKHILRMESETSTGINRTVTSQGVIDDGCAKRFYFGQYAFLVEANSVNRVHLTSTEPAQFRYHFFSPSESEGVVFQVNYYRPNAVQVERAGVRIPSQVEKLPPQVDDVVFPRINSAHGSNQLDAQNRTLHLTLRGTDEDYTAAHLDAIRLPTIQLNLRLSVSMEEFFGENFVQHLATALDIDPSRIKIVDVQPGSTVVQIEIHPPEGAVSGVDDVTNVPDENNTFQSDGDIEYFHLDPAVHEHFYSVVSDMDELVHLITSMAESGELFDISDYEIESIVMTPPLNAPSSPDTSEEFDDLINEPDKPLTPKSKRKNTNVFSVGSIVAIVVGGILAALIIVVLLLAVQRNVTRRRKITHRRKVHGEPSQGTAAFDSASVGVIVGGSAHSQQSALYGDSATYEGDNPLPNAVPSEAGIEVSDSRLKFTPKVQTRTPQSWQNSVRPTHAIAPSYGQARMGARIT